nr:7504_t:CDS:2 [Entrophospora candida]
MSNYFDRKSSKWNIIDFINETDIKSFDAAIDFYIKTLEKTSNNEQGAQQKRALELLDRYRKARSLLGFLCSRLLADPGGDRKLAKDRWEMKLRSGSGSTFNVYSSTFSGSAQIGINEGKINIEKENHEKEGGFLTKRMLRKRKFVNYNESPSEMDSSDSEYQEKLKEPKGKSTMSENDIDDYDNDKITDEQKAYFNSVYRSLNTTKMWTLKSSGRIVEKVIYEYARTLTYESYLHSFIINDVDAATISLFSEEEWKEITTSEIKDKPKLEHFHVELLKKYTVDNVKELRKALFEPFVSGEDEYNKNIHFDLDFINYAYRGMLFLWEKEEDPFDPLKLEGWYEMDVWSRLIDPAFSNLNIDLVRGEGMSLASSNRKNHGRSIADRKIIGRKGDGVFRLCKKRLEFGAIETGRKWEGQCGTKYLADSLKLCKMLKDMLVQLSTECDWLEDFVRKLQVVGVLQGANRVQVITMDYPKGYVFRVQRRKVHEVSGRLTKSVPLALVLKEILCAKSIIIQTLDIINRKNDVNVENFLDDSYEDEYRTLSTIEAPPTFTTPNTLRTKDMINKGLLYHID